MSTAITDPRSPAAWRTRIEKCKTERRQLVSDWTDNVEFRRGKPFEDASDADRINVNLDAPRTKARVASLFSQMPEVRLTETHPAFAAAVPVFAKLLNDTLTDANTGDAVLEAVNDCVNAAGIGVAVVGYERRTEKVQVPAVDLSTLPPEVAAQLLASGQVPMEEVDRTTDEQFTVRRISPDDFLWPTEFTNFNFDAAPWIGRSGVMSWAEAKHEFHLTDEQREQVVGATRPANETIRQSEDTRADDVGMVAYDEIYYRTYRFDPDEPSFDAITRMVFVSGIDTPVVNEPWSGQRLDDQSGSHLGATIFPIRVLKFTYITDDAIPPSDSALARPQVLELIKTRTQQNQQRDRSIPVRGFDPNRVDPAIIDNLQRGTYQGMIPVLGNGQGAIWEVSQAHYPPENVAIERAIRHDLDEIWQSGANQNGAFATGERSASEANIVQSSFETRNGFDRGCVGAFITGIAEVMAGLLALYGNVEELGADQQQLLDQSWDRTRINQGFVFTIRPDSTVLLDANQRIQRLMNVLNMVGKSGFINPGPIVREIIELAGLDPAVVMTQPNPPAAEPVNVSIRVSNEDLMNPIVLAMLTKTGQAPSPEEVEAAKRMMIAAQQPPAPVPPAPPVGPVPFAPPGTATAPSEIEMMPKINKRSEYD